MKRIRSGQAFLYRDGGIRSTVFDIRMKDKVRGDLLRRALDKAMERYQYLASKLVEKNDVARTKVEAMIDRLRALEAQA